MWSTAARRWNGQWTRLHIRQDKDSRHRQRPQRLVRRRPGRAGAPSQTPGACERGDDSHCGRAAAGIGGLRFLKPAAPPRRERMPERIHPPGAHMSKCTYEHLCICGFCSKSSASRAGCRESREGHNEFEDFPVGHVFYGLVRLMRRANCCRTVCRRWWRHSAGRPGCGVSSRWRRRWPLPKIRIANCHAIWPNSWKVEAGRAFSCRR